MTELTWLIVGGCPRSGTTALGEALNQSGKIALFHEVDTSTFFDAIDRLFKDEERHRRYETFAFYSDAMPIRERDASGIAGDISARVLRKRAPIIGTKFPGHHEWPVPSLPPRINMKEVMITRNPHETILSYIRKMRRESFHGAQEDVVDTAVTHWVRAWNYAARKRTDSSFLHVFYDDLDGKNERLAANIARFLQIDDDIDLSGLMNTPRSDVQREYEQEGLQKLYSQIETAWAYDEWGNSSKTRFAMGFQDALPIQREGIDFRVGGNSWQYAKEGLYPPETEGAWTYGTDMSLAFRASEPAEQYALTLTIVWAPLLADEYTRCRVIISGEEVANSEFHVDGNASEFVFSVPGRAVKNGIVDMKLEIKNPRNPAKLGISSDNRELGLMLQSLTFERR